MFLRYRRANRILLLTSSTHSTLNNVGLYDFARVEKLEFLNHCYEVKLACSGSVLLDRNVILF